MTTARIEPATPVGPNLAGQTVVVLGGTAGIGYATARTARDLGADVIITGRDQARLDKAGTELGALSTAAFDATDLDALDTFFGTLPTPVDHIMVTAGGSYYSTLADIDLAEVRKAFDEHLLLTLAVARNSLGKVRAGGTLIFMTGTAARHPAAGSEVPGIFAAALPALVANLALDTAPIRVNLIAAGFVDTGLSASLLGAGLDARRAELRATLPIRRVVEPGDVAAVAVHLMTNTAVTGSTFDVDGGQKLL
jgi:NAD(P)-dependent dehydrogenase (short-subunit alcohol dehydrogenase family)